MPLASTAVRYCRDIRSHCVTWLRDQWWKRHTGTQRSFVFPIEAGVKVRLYLDSELSRQIYYKHFEYIERDFLNRFLRPGDIFVDVGANIGLFSLLAAKRIGKGGQVHSFEPTPETMARLKDNVQLNDLANVQCHPLALSDRAETLKLTRSTDGYDAWNSLAQPDRGETFTSQMVETTTWDDFAETHGLVGRVTMMKIDVEGWETFVLNGARQTLSRPDAPLLQVEFANNAAHSAGSSCEELYHYLEHLGYQMFTFSPEANRLEPDALRPAYVSANLYAVKDLEVVKRRLEEFLPHRSSVE